MSEGNTRGTLEGTVRQHGVLIIGVLVVLFIGFAAAFIAVGGMIINSEAEKKADYQQLETQVQNQNTQIQVLTNQLKNSTVTTK